MNVGSVSPIGADIILKLPPYILYWGFPCLGEMVNWSCNGQRLWYDKEDEMWSRSTSLASQHTDHHHICIALVSNGQWYGKEREGNIVISGRTLNWPTLMNAKYICMIYKETIGYIVKSYIHQWRESDRHLWKNTRLIYAKSLQGHCSE